MGAWTEAHDRLQKARQDEADIEELERQAARELEQLLDEES